MCDSDHLSSESDCIIELYEFDASTDAEVPETPDMPDDSSEDDSPTYVTEMVPLQCSTRVKRPAPSCLICDHETRGWGMGGKVYDDFVKPRRECIACILCQKRKCECDSFIYENVV